MAVVCCRAKYFRKLKIQTFCVKYASSSSKNEGPGSRFVKPLVGLKQFLAQKCFAFVEGYEKILKTRFPRAFKVYQVFSVGSKELYGDFMEYMRISNELRIGKAVRDLTRTELEKYFQVPKDVIKVTPTLIVAALPFANYVIFPLAYAFPKMFLSPQFWSLQQKIDFAVDKQRRKLVHYRPVFRMLQFKVNSVPNDELRGKFSSILSKLDSGVHPNVEEVLSVKCLFEERPYSLSSLPSSHLVRSPGLRSIVPSYYKIYHEDNLIRPVVTSLSFKTNISSSC